MYKLKLSISILLLVINTALFSQKKNFSYEQLFGGKFPEVFKPLPAILGWADDDHYLEARNVNGTNNIMLVEVSSGNAEPYYDRDKSSMAPVPTIQGALNITLSPDGKMAAYTKSNNLFSLELSTGKETQLTTDGSDSIMNGYASWVYYEEILGRASHYKAFWWSPDSKFLAFMRFDDSKVPLFPIYIEEGQHGHLEQERYPKAGDNNPEVKMGLVAVKDPSVVWADFNSTDDQYFGTPVWTPANELWVQWMNREQDSLIVYQVGKTSGKKKQVYTEHQSTWITLNDYTRFSFLKENGGCIIKSDKSGWQNLYLYDLNGKLINQVTNGHFWGTKVLNIDEKNKQIFIQAKKQNSNRNDIFRIALNGKKETKLSSGNYNYDPVYVSPSGKYIIAGYSTFDSPPAFALFNYKGKQIRELGNYKGAEFNNYEMPRSELFSVKSADGKFDLPLCITYPVNFDSLKKYPVWIFIYGGPNYSNVLDRWRGGTGMAQWWAQEGVIQVSMDNRSSGHFGKEGMNYIFRQLGKYEIEDYMACGRWLKGLPYVDSSKIGITGGSFGGYLTCMALTYGAGVFNFGIADYPVTDWKLYDTHYTERFMNKPRDNSEGYAKTSVMNYAKKYKGLLRIVHGTTDDNVHMQNSLQLISVLQDLDKHFELMIVPGQRHGIRGVKNEFDQRETARFVYRYLLEKPLPADFAN